MKVLTLTQPWATLVAIGAKTMETRSWETMYRGPLLIHAAKGYPRDAKDFASASGVVAVTGMKPLEYPTGAILAQCNLVACIRTTEEFERSLARDSKQEWMFGNFEPGRFAWKLQNIRKLAHPIPAKGALGLWNWAVDLGSFL